MSGTYTHFIYDHKGKLIGFNDDEDEAKVIADSHGGHYQLEEVRNSTEFLQTSDILREATNTGCPHCGSYEGDWYECPECGHGQ